jgi:molybdopterin synthase sulfur carrier subunit
MPLIKIPPVLRSSVGGEKEITADGGDVGAVLRSLAAQHPDTESQLFGADDVLVILPAMAGGA